MSNYSRMKRSKLSLGFTLIELLVVIGVLGILAAGLLATIDPLEQFRKGADSNRKTTSLELVNALTRYYAVHNAFPWKPIADGGAGCNSATPPSAVAANATGFTNTATPIGCLVVLQNEGELKSTFKDQTLILTKLFVTDTTVGENASVAVCYNPESKSESARSETKYTQAGADSASGVCPANTGTCYWCAR